jgi:hypothetical protein
MVQTRKLITGLLDDRIITLLSAPSHETATGSVRGSALDLSSEQAKAGLPIQHIPTLSIRQRPRRIAHGPREDVYRWCGDAQL